MSRRIKKSTRRKPLGGERLERREVLSANNAAAAFGDYDLSGVVDQADYDGLA